jgi:hypothetical protein
MYYITVVFEAIRKKEHNLFSTVKVVSLSDDLSRRLSHPAPPASSRFCTRVYV